MSIPNPSEAASVDAKEAKREVRLQTANWNAYKERLAAAVGTGAATPDEAGQAAGGKLTGPVEDRGAAAQAQPKEVLKLSKGEAAGSRAAQERIRSLEEEVAAREKTIREQTERVAKLEKTVKDMQSLIDIKSKPGADLQKPAVTPAPPEAKPAMPAKPSMPEPAKPELPAPPAHQTMPAQPPIVAEHAPEAAAAGTSMAQSGTAAAPTAKPKPARKPTKAAAEPAPQSLVDQILGEPMYLGAGAVCDRPLGIPRIQDDQEAARR